MTDTTFPAKDCCTQSGSRRTGNVSTALLQSHKNYFHPPPRLYKLLVFRLQCVKRPERCVPLDLALVMVTSLHRRRGNTETWQPSNTFLQSQHPATAQSQEVCTGSPLIPSHLGKHSTSSFSLTYTMAPQRSPNLRSLKSDRWREGCYT